MFVNVQVGESPACTVTLTVLSPWSYPAEVPWLNAPPCPVPMAIVAPFAVHAMFVSVQPVSAVSVTYLSPSCVPLIANGASVVGFVVPVLRLNGDSPSPDTVYPNVAVPPIVLFWIASEAPFVFVKVHEGEAPGASVTLIVLSPASYPAVAPWLKDASWPVPIAMVAPPVVQAMFVSDHPVSADSVTYLTSESCVPVKLKAASVVGLALAVLREKEDSPVPLTV